MKSDAAEAWGYALLLTRRVLTTALSGVSEAQLHCATPLGTLADCAAEACAAEAGLVWPETLPPARLDPAQTPVQALYALVRHRAVTEEVLMQATDASMREVWWTRARRLAQDPPQALAESLRQLAEQELEIAARSADIRARIDPDWSAQPELTARARQAVAVAIT